MILSELDKRRERPEAPTKNLSRAAHKTHKRSRSAGDTARKIPLESLFFREFTKYLNKKPFPLASGCSRRGPEKIIIRHQNDVGSGLVDLLYLMHQIFMLLSFCLASTALLFGV